MKKFLKLSTFYREDELESKWWHRLIKVLIYGSTIIVIILSVVSFIKNTSDWNNSDPRYIYSFEPKYSETVGFSKPCTFASGNSEDSPIIDCGNVGQGWSGNTFGFLPDFLERYAKSISYREEFLKRVPFENCGANTSNTDNFFCKFTTLKIDYKLFKDKIEQGEFNNIQAKRIIILPKLLKNIAVMLFIPLIWFFLVKSVIYRAFIYIVLGKKINFMEKEKIKSFKLSSGGENKKGFVSMKDWGRKEYGRNSLIGGLGGYIASMSGIMIIEIIGDVLILAGLVCGIIYIYKTVQEKRLNKTKEN